jgi:hypothetical protein
MSDVGWVLNMDFFILKTLDICAHHNQNHTKKFIIKQYENPQKTYIVERTIFMIPSY